MKDPLHQYRKKRDFSVTPEPAGSGTSEGGALQFVIQKHWARSLHYDLRLELDGTMKSWAVPKGPSFDPSEKRMAIQVEDHPLSYNSFEGQIPAGQYGAGRVVVWDRGYWVPLGDEREGYRKGKLKFRLHGHKMRGDWTLVRLHGRDHERQPPWLLIKDCDGLERSVREFSVVEEMPDSVAGLPLPLMRSGNAAPVPDQRDCQLDLNGSAGKSAQEFATAAHSGQGLPLALAPQLAMLVDKPPPDPARWVWELKFDGYRMLARVDHGDVRMFTRTGNDWTAKMASLAHDIAALPLKSGWVDGEVMVLDRNGVPDFHALQNTFDDRSTGDLVFYAFDLPYADGHDLRDMPLVERRQRLRGVLETSASDRIRFSESFDVLPTDLVSSACQLGFEGVVGKRKDARYVSRRDGEWIKLKCGHRQEFVIAGFTDPQGSRKGIGALVLGLHDDDGVLRYAGNVGSGFSEYVLEDLHERLVKIAVKSSPLGNPHGVEKKVHWVAPRLVAEVAFADWTAQGRVRHAVFKGLRADKRPTEVRKEHPSQVRSVLPSNSLPSAPTAMVGSTRISNATREIDPSTGITKLDIVRYYSTVALLMLGHLKARPVSLVRIPQGVGGECFFQKHWDTGSLAGVMQLPERLYPGHPPLLEVVSDEGLLSAVQMNAVEFHTWNSRKDRMDRPDRVTFDLDPGDGVPWGHVQESANLVRLMLTELGLPAFLKTSGGKGLHVIVPIKRLHDWVTVKSFSQAIVQHLARTLPQRFVAKSGPKNRVGKVFADYLRNGLGATTASAWTVRARPGMGVSVPVAWEELDKITGGAHWTLRTVDRRLHIGNSPWHGYDNAAVSLTQAIKALGRIR